MAKALLIYAGAAFAEIGGCFAFCADSDEFGRAFRLMSAT
jgi:drug/metabolite transporter superfamily protein YnfA